MNTYKSMMRRMRQYTADVKRNLDTRASEMKKLSEYRGSTFYDKKVAELDKQTEEKRVAIAKAAQGDLMKYVQTMRDNVGKRIAKAPTADMVNSLSLLGMLNTINPTQISVYAQQMADCPLAMQVLQQIAGKHNMRIHIPDTDEMMRAVDVIESNLAAYLNGYKGTEDNMSFTVKNLYRYFQSEEAYVGTPAKSADNVDAAFWADIIQVGNPALLEDGEISANAVKVKHFFKDVDALRAYIDYHTQGLEGADRTNKVNEILRDCPGQYGAAYRYFQTSGEKVPLMESDE